MSFARWKRIHKPVWHSDIPEAPLPAKVRKRHQWLHQHIAYDQWRIRHTRSKAAKRRLRRLIAGHRREIARIHAAYAAPASSSPGSTSTGSASTAVIPPPQPNAPEAGFAFFQHGVASGDPLPDRVVIWTRVTPAADATPASGLGPSATVLWHVALDAGFTSMVGSGSFVTTADRDHTVKLDVTGLSAATTYFYRFVFQGPWRDAQVSPVGRTRTTVAADATPAGLRLGVVSCANAQAGWFSAYRHLAARDDLDVVVHLGDYLYEYAPGAYGNGYAQTDIRSHEPPEQATTLRGYRLRHAQYKRDADLAALHVRYPFITTWDDHEFADNAWRDGTTGDSADAITDWAATKAAAQRAYDEWMPIRLEGTVALGDGSTIYRRFRFGQLAELTMLDLRSYRDEQVATPTSAEVNDADRTITGADQMSFLRDGLSVTAPQWRLVGNPVMMAPLQVTSLPQSVRDLLDSLGGGAYLPETQGLNTDQWDGYTHDRSLVLDHIVDQGVRDVVFITGDIHTSWAIEVPYPVTDTLTYGLMGSTAGVEFVCPSVTSNNIKDAVPGDPTSAANLAAGTTAAAAVRAANPQIKYLDFNNHGYLVVDVTPARVQSDWWFISDRADPRATVAWGQSWATSTGTGLVHQLTEPVA
ncbi:MAG: alkaline phosphatase D family protein [Nocardioides sp.]|uniref:alkaline phosphatase D family protein n=1 Tax=Nocardioides sp. TaxID=35761 RepID=UPI0039E22748